MSVYYEMKEHLSTNTESGAGILAIQSMAERLSLLCSRMLLDKATIRELTLTADGVSAAFHGSTVTEELQGILRMLRHADEVELFVEYGYLWQASMDYLPLDSMELCDALEALSDTELGGMYYTSSCVRSGHEEDPVLMAYGRDASGRFHRGLVVYSPAGTLPEEGLWESEHTAVEYEQPAGSLIDSARMEDILSQLVARGLVGSVTRDPRGRGVHLYHTRVRNAGELRDYILLLGSLHRVTDGTAYCDAELTDRRARDPRRLMIRFDEAINPVYAIAQA